MTTWAEHRDAFEAAAQWFVAVAGEAGGHLEEPGLGEWSVRDLIGHTSRALLTVESYLARPVTTAEVRSRVEYFASFVGSGGVAAEVARRGREAGSALGEDPGSALQAIAARVLECVRGADEGALVTTPVGGMRLID